MTGCAATIATAGVTALLLACGPAQAFWKRSHIAACGEARSEDEWLGRQCWVFDPVPEFPPPLLSRGWDGRTTPHGAHRGRPGRGPVVRRLG